METDGVDRLLADSGRRTDSVGNTGMVTHM